MGNLIICNFILLIFAANAEKHDINKSPNIRFLNVDRLIDISSQIVKVTHKITLENAGTEPIDSFHIMREPKFEKNAAVTKFQLSDSDVLLKTQVSMANGHLAWNVLLKSPLEPGKIIVVDVYYALINSLIPYPTKITQNEKQYIKFIGNSYIFAAYPVSKVTTSIALGTKNIESYTKVEPTSYSDSHILYGPYKDLPPFSIAEIEIHYENNSPFLVASRLVRKIEVSHWGNIAVEEDITLEHTGAKLKGPFSRYDYQREPESGLSSVKVFKTILPGSASDIYYRDEIGNISTSHLYNLENSVEVELRPRFPLFGGWNTRYTLGYNLPSYTCLYTKDDNYVLKIPLIDHIYDNMVIKEAVIQIILPEGSHDFELTLPYEVYRIPDGVHRTYLDTLGRPVLTMVKRDLIEDHISNFELRYKFSKIYMLFEPMLIIGFLFSLFLFVIVYVRLDFSLSKDETAEQRLRVSGLCSKFISDQCRRLKLYESFNEKFTIAKYNLDLNSFNAAVKNFNNEYKNLSTQITDVASKLKSESPESADKITEIQKLDKQLKEIYSQQQTFYIEKLIPRKISKSVFLEADTSFIKKRDECVTKIHKLAKSLE